MPDREKEKEKEKAEEQREQKEQQREQQREQERSQSPHRDTAGQPAQSPPQPGAPAPPNMEAVLEQLIDIQPLQGSGFRLVGRCKKCGWQTMQQDEDEAKSLVMQHAQIHWPEIQALAVSGGAAESAMQPAGAPGGKPAQKPTAERI